MTGRSRSFARGLRKRQTQFEEMLWHQVRAATGLQARSFAVRCRLGGYVVDFFCLDAKLIVEVDGRQHGWEVDYDEERTRALEGMGLAVLRFTNDEIRDGLAGVLHQIARALRRPTS